MAALLSAADFHTALTREGCTLVALPGWENHNRDAGHTPLTPNGVVIHHTGSDTTDPVGYSRNVLWSGYAGLPGPLCHAGGAPDGTIILTGHGRANHAGGGDQATLNAVTADAVPMDGELHPRFGNTTGVDGNSRFYGLEIIYSGGHPMTAAQRVAAVKFAAALCRAHGWSARSVIGHKEWSSDKVDPGQCPMNLFRADVAAALSLPAGQWPHTAPPSTPEDFMANMSDANQKKLVDAADEMLAFKGYWRHMYNNSEWNHTILDKLGPQIAALTIAMAAVQADPNLDTAALSKIFSDALAAQVTVTGTLTVDPKPPA